MVIAAGALDSAEFLRRARSLRARVEQNSQEIEAHQQAIEARMVRISELVCTLSALSEAFLLITHQVEPVDAA